MRRSAEQEPFLLLQTKLHVPRIRDDLIPRPRLVERLNRGFDRRLTLVCAPAGYGKTTLLTQWLADSPRPAAWLTLDENDNDLVLFLSYVIAAIQVVYPEACPETSILLKAAQLPPQDYLATTLINEIDRLPEPGLLVLDDYHRIEDQAVHRLVAALMTSRLRAMHLVLASRTEPPLPFARLRVGRKMAEIRAEDLRFTLDEAEAFLNTAVGMTLSDEAMDTLETRTEGWIAGLRLAALSLRRHAYPGAFVQQFSGTHRDLADYLINEVLEQMSPVMQGFLLRTSILDRFCAPLCDAVCFGSAGTAVKDEKSSAADGEFSSGVARASPRSQTILAELDQANMFLVPLDYEREWYRYHHLFRDLLRSQLQERVSTPETATLQRRASAWFASQRLITEALRHALAAGDALDAARLVEENWYEVLNREDWRTLEHWLGMLPDEMAARRPGLLAARAWTIWFQFRLREIEALLQEAEAGLDRGDTTVAEADERALRGAIDALRSYVWLVRYDDVQHSLTCAERALGRLPGTFAIGRGIALDFLCLAYQAIGRKEEAVRLLSKALNTPTLRGAARMQAFIALSLTHLLSGDLYRLEEIASPFLEQAIQERQSTSTGWAHYLLGQVCYEWNDLEAAARHFSTVADRRHSASFITVLGSMLGLARARLAQGRLDQALETLDTLREHSLKVSKTAALTEMDAFQAHLALTQGNTASATQWTRSFDPQQVKEPFSVLYPPTLTRDWILIARGTTSSLQEAVRHLQEQLAAAGERHNTRRVIQIRALLALAYNAQGQEQDALQALEQAVVLARPGGFVRTFVDLGPEMARLLYQLAERGVAPDYVGHVLAAFQRSDEGRGTKDEEDAAIEPKAKAPSMLFFEPLTRRELEVLKLLNEDLSNQEIARVLVISPLTVKRHASNIYAKLGVSGRRRAVAQAKTLGILPRD